MKVQIVLVVCSLSVALGLPAGLVKNTPKNIQRLANLKGTDYAEELSGQFEGDIVLNDIQRSRILSRTGLINTQYRWDNNLIPYEIDTYTFSPAQVKHIIEGLRTIEAVTCIRFTPYNPAEHVDYVHVIGSGSGCWSMVGRQGGRQELHLELFDVETGCFRLSTVVHEFMHAIGFYHMQSAPERDEYVEIIWDNIEDGLAHNFNKYEDNYVNNFGVEYDYSSVMHYGPTAFSINDLPTIVPRDKNAEIGQRIGLSAKDITRINSMYCPEQAK